MTKYSILPLNFLCRLLSLRKEMKLKKRASWKDVIPGVFLVEGLVKAFHQSRCHQSCFQKLMNSPLEEAVHCLRQSDYVTDSTTSNLSPTAYACQKAMMQYCKLTNWSNISICLGYQRCASISHGSYMGLEKT